MKSLKLNLWETTTYLIVFLVLITGMILSFANQEFYENTYAVEDGVIEYATALMLLIGSLLSLKRLFNKSLDRSIPWMITTSLIVLAFFFGAGEEISWGQRILGIESGEFFEEHNAQQEINFHNLMVGDVKINRLVFGQLLTIVLVVYLIILPVLYRKNQRLQSFLDRFGVPIPKVHHAVAFVVATIIVTVMPSSKRWEIYEFAFGFIFFIILLFPLNRYIYLPKNGN